MYIKVKVSPGAKKETLIETANKYFTVSVREKAEHNMANRRVIEIFAEYFEVPVGSIKIISGHRSPNKILSVREN